MAELTARLDHVGLAVVDLGAAAAWYCDVFGLVPELSLRVDAIDLSIEMLIHPGFGYRVELLHRPGTGTGADVDLLNRVLGTVEDVTYEGALIAYGIALDDGQRVLVREQNRGESAARPRHRTGDRVTISWNPADALLFA